MSEHCPQCGARAEPLPQTFISASWTAFACGSVLHGDGHVHQAEACRVRELEAENDRLRKRVEELEQFQAIVEAHAAGRWADTQAQQGEGSEG